MKNLMLLWVLLTGLALSGCEFVAGTLVGAGAAGGGYEYQAYRRCSSWRTTIETGEYPVRNTKTVKDRSRRDRSCTDTAGVAPA